MHDANVDHGAIMPEICEAWLQPGHNNVGKGFINM